MHYVTGTIRVFPHNYYYSHCTDEETDPGRLSNLSKAVKIAIITIRFETWSLSENHALMVYFEEPGFLW